MLYEKKYFGTGHGNFDDADFVLQPNEWINLENARVGSTDSGVIGTVESVGSMTLLSTIQPSVTNVMVGAVEDPANFRIIYFLKDLYGPFDKIVAYNVLTNTFYNVLLSDQVIGGLNFSKNAYVHSVRTIDGLLYWTDYLNQPRRININAGINLNHPGTFPNTQPYTSPLTAEVITIIRKPPAYPLTFAKIENVDIETNQIGKNSFRFTYQYVYRDGEQSTLAPHSLLAPYNYPNETFNVIDITVPFSEKIDQDVQLINLIVIYVDTNTGFIIKVWNKNNGDDAIEIANHNAGITALNFEFANDAIGPAISSPQLAKPYDSVPILCETLEQGSSRLFLGRNLVGYNTPTFTSLTAQIFQQNSEEGTQGEWLLFTFNQDDVGFILNTVLAYFPTPIDATHPAGLYDFAANPLQQYQYSPPSPPPSMPSEIDIDDYVFLISDYTTPDATFFFQSYVPPIYGGTPGSGTFSLNPSGQSVVTSNSIVSGNVQILKSDSPYRLGIVFYDQYLRQCGVVSNDDLRITTPDRSYSLSSIYDYGIQWNLPTGFQGEIPDWAYYYSIVSTKSLRTSFFQQARAGDLKYATKDSDGNFLFTETNYFATNFGVALKLDMLNGYGMGYSFQDGDIVKIYIDGDSTIYSLAVLDQSANWLIAELTDLGNVSSKDAFFEVYTPVSQSAAEIFFEVGSIYNILDPTTLARRFSTIQGFLPGDVYLLQRGSSPDEYLTENMSPNTTLWRNWFTNVGRIQIFDPIGQQFKQTSIKWSNTLIPGTISNGLSTFDALDEKILPGELGPLRKLQITSKVNNEQGAVMLGICEQETASMYLGETQLVASAQNAFVAQSTGVIGTVNILKGSFGTLNPEGVTEYKGNVYWVDTQNNKVVQYSLNGLYPISNYKMTRYWKQWCETVEPLTAQDIEALGSRPYIFCAVDPHHWELLVTVPKVLQTPPNGYLPDMPGVIYPFDIWDGLGKTLVYKINAEPNFWIGAYTYETEGYVTFGNKLFSFKYGQLYQHNSTTSFNNFYGIQNKSRIMFVANQQPERDKVYNNISIEANMLPSLTYFMSLSPYTQVSNLMDFDWEQKESTIYSQIYRNVLTPTATGLKPNGLITGEKMRTYALRIMLEFSVSTLPLELRFTTLGYQLSLGHSTPVQ